MLNKLIVWHAVGKTSNCCLVMAQLITQGKKRGIHLFFLQLRDLDTHRLMPGIDIHWVNVVHRNILLIFLSRFNDRSDGYSLLKKKTSPLDFILLYYRIWGLISFLKFYWEGVGLKNTYVREISNTLVCHDLIFFTGVESGDIGSKFGFQSNDNGYLKLSNVRIPRENMLMRYSKVRIKTHSFNQWEKWVVEVHEDY